MALAPIAPGIQAPHQYASRFPAEPDHCPLCLDLSHTSDACPVVLLEFLVVLPKQKESNEITTFCKKSNTVSREWSYYRGVADLSAHYSQAPVLQHSNRNPQTASRDQEHDNDVDPDKVDDGVPWTTSRIVCTYHHESRQDFDN